jgi:DNA phosphorothioation-dependent restriction protein DptG
LPLSERARIEVYLPDLPSVVYQELLDVLKSEFTYTFGGCSLIRGLNGSYQSQLGLPIEDRINLLYTDTPLSFDESFDSLSRYTDALRQTAFEALEEEAMLIVALKIYHSV